MRKYIIENNIKQIKDEKNVFFLEKLINRALLWGYYNGFYLPLRDI